MYKKICIIILLLVGLCSIAGASSVQISQNCIAGSITSDVILENISSDSQNNESFFIGTDVGVYSFSSKGGIENFFETGSQVTNVKTISDINGNNNKELVISISDNYFPNLICIDGLTGEKIWDYSAEMLVYDEHMMWTTKQLPIIDLEISDNDDIYLSAGYSVICLDKEGKQINFINVSDNIWDIVLVDDNVIFGSQNGYIYQYEKHLIKESWKKLLSKSYSVIESSTKEIKGTVTRSVWDIVPVQVGNGYYLAVSCEDGYLYILDSKNGKILQLTQIIDYVDSLLSRYYLESSSWETPTPTHIGQFNFFNIRLLKIDDITSDQISEIAVYTYPGSTTGRGYQAYEQKIFTVDPTTASIIDNKEFNSLSYIEDLTTIHKNHEEFIILPSTNSKISLIPTNNLKSTSNVLDLNFTFNIGSSNCFHFKDLASNHVLISSDLGDVRIVDYSGNLYWSYPRITDMTIETHDLVGSSLEDFLVYSHETGDSGDLLAKGSSKIIYVINGENKEITWTNNLSQYDSLFYDGFSEIHVFDDIDADGKDDITFYLKPNQDSYYSQDLIHSRIITVSGASGKTIYNKDFNELISKYMVGNNDLWFNKNINSFEVISDISGDFLSDIMISCEKNVFILNGSNGNIIWHRSNYQEFCQNKAYELCSWIDNNGDNDLHFLSLGDVNGDSYDELLEVSGSNLVILNSRYVSSYVDYSIKKMIEITDGSFDSSRVSIIDDVNGDTVNDIMLSIWLGEGLDDVYRIYCGDTGDELIEFKRWGTTIDVASADFNDDGALDSIIYSSEGESGPKIEIWDGTFQQVLWSSTQGNNPWWLRETFHIEQLSPACPAGDVNNDGNIDLAVGWFYPHGKGAEIKIYDVNHDELIKSIVLEAKSEEATNEVSEWIHTITIVQISDVTGDGFDDIATIMPLGESNQKQFKLIVVDILNEEIVCDFNALGTDIKHYENLIYTYGSNGAIYFLDPEKTLTISNQQEESKSSSPLQLVWDDTRNETVKIIMIDGNNIMKTLSDKAKFDIKQGSHRVSVYSFDRYGKGVYSHVNVNIQKTSLVQLPLSLLFIALIFLLFSPTIISLVYNKSNQIRNHHDTEKLRRDD